MKFSSIEIEDVLGVEHVKFAPGNLVILSGRNGAGKSSIVKGLRYVFSGGHDPSMIRNGAKKGVVRLEFDNGAKITKTITPKKNTVEIEANDYTGSPETYIQELVDAFSFDPAKFLVAKSKDLFKQLLEMLPLNFKAKELAFLNPEPGEEYTLQQVDAIRQQIYDARAGHNKSAKALDAHAAELRKALLPDGEDKDWTAEEERAEAELRRIDEAAAEGIAAADKMVADQKSALDAKYAEDLQKIRAAAQSMKDAVRAETEVPKKVAVTALATAKERARQQEQSKGAQAAIERTRKEAREQYSASSECDTLLEKIDELKKAKLTALPVKGLEFRDGELFVDGVQWEQVNTARRVKLAFQLALMCAGKIKFMLLDNAEALDAEHWKAFEDYCLKQKDWQVLAARVGEGPLHITNLVEAA